jgi:phosphate-selective porin OprO and OprP
MTKNVRLLRAARGAVAIGGVLIAGSLGAQQGGPAAVAGSDGFALRSADGAFVLRLRGMVQSDGRFFLEEAPEASVDQFLLRRVRSDVQGTIFEDYDFRVQVDFSGGRFELMDAHGNVGFSPALQARAGKMKVPLGLERLQSSAAVPFAERGFPTLLVPDRDVGVQLHGVLAGARVEYAIGVFNGVPDGASADLDTDGRKDLTARLFLTPFGAPALRGLGFGIGASVGDPSGSVAATGLAPYRTSGRNVFFHYRADGEAAGTAVAAGRRTRISPQAAWYHRNLGLLSEYVSVNHAVSVGQDRRDLRNEAWQIAGSWVVTGEDASFRGIVPRTEFDRGAGTWGALELAARANVLRLDPQTFNRYANPFDTVQSAYAYSAAVNWHLNRAVRLLLNFEHTAFAGAPGGFLRSSENLLVTRFQLAF